VIPTLQTNQLAKFASGDLTLDALTREFINTRLEYQFALVDSSTAAVDVRCSWRVLHFLDKRGIFLECA